MRPGRSVKSSTWSIRLNMTPSPKVLRKQRPTFERARLGQAQHQVHVLDRLSRRSLDKIVDRRDEDLSAGGGRQPLLDLRRMAVAGDPIGMDALGDLAEKALLAGRFAGAADH